MASKLDEIIAATRQHVAQTKAAAELRALESAAEEHQPRGFRDAIRRVSESRPAIIAELKKRSPSKGLIRSDFPVGELATELQSAGAAALSVLTDEKFFEGSLQNLEIASAATQIPCLRKDFIVDDFQVLEARAHRADAILLIVAALSQRELTGLQQRAREVGVDVLCEVHDAVELERAVNAGCEMIGVNNRNLHTFRVDLDTSVELASRMPRHVTKVAESGIETGEDIARLRREGFDGFLIGESLMRAPRPGKALRELVAESVAGLAER